MIKEQELLAKSKNRNIFFTSLYFFTLIIYINES